MGALRSALSRFWSVVRRDRDGDIKNELDRHIQLHTSDGVRGGMTQKEARRHALCTLGGLQQTVELCRDRRGLRVFDSLVQDVRYAIRMLFKAPIFSLMAISTLALGIGGTTTIFSVVDTVLYRPPPYREPTRLVVIHESFAGVPRGMFSPVNALHFQEWQKTGAFEQMSLVAPFGFTLTGKGEPDSLAAARVSSSFFAVLGVQPVLGRSFLPEEDQPGRERVVVIADSLWRRRFDADPAVIGRFITLDGEPHQVVGVLPRQFQFPQVTQLYSMSLSIPGADSPEIWRPFAATPQELRLFGSFNFACIARLALGLSAEQALAKVNGVQSALASRVPGLAELRAVFTPFQEQIVRRSRRGLEITLAAVCVVFLIAAVNISNLLLTRSMARRREIAIRVAIGATRGRLIRQTLVESTTLAGFAGLLGIALAHGLVPLIVAYAPADLPRLDEVQIDMRVLAFAVVLSMIAGFSTVLYRPCGPPQPHRARAQRPRGADADRDHRQNTRARRWSGSRLPRRRCVSSLAGFCSTALCGCSRSIPDSPPKGCSR